MDANGRKAAETGVARGTMSAGRSLPWHPLHGDAGGRCFLQDAEAVHWGQSHHGQAFHVRRRVIVSMPCKHRVRTENRTSSDGDNGDKKNSVPFRG